MRRLRSFIESICFTELTAEEGCLLYYLLLDRYDAPGGAVEVAVVDRLADMLERNLLRAIEVGNGAGHLEDAVVSSRREVPLYHRLTQDLHSVALDIGELLHQAWRHLSIAMDAGVGGKALELYLSRLDDPLADRSTALGGATVGERVEVYGTSLDLYVYAV